MDFESAKDRLEHYLNNGVVKAIYLAYHSYSILMAIGKSGRALDGLAYKAFFQNLQGILSDHIVIHIAKLYEPNNPRHPVISIPTVIQSISDNLKDLPIIERRLLSQQLESLQISIPNVIEMPHEELGRLLLAHFQDRLPSLATSSALQSLKVIRDKRIAHRDAEDISEHPTTTFQEARKLIEFAQEFTIIIGAAFTSTLYGFTDREFFLFQDADRTVRALEMLISDIARVDAERRA